MSHLHRYAIAIAVASALTLTACNSGQDHSHAGQPAAASTSSAVTVPLIASQVNVQMTLHGAPTLSADGKSVDVTVDLANHGKTALSSKGSKPVNLGAHSVDANGKIIDTDLARAALPDIAPGNTAMVTIQLPVEKLNGKSAQILPVQEGVAWFDSFGTTPLTVGPFKSCETSAMCGADGKPLATGQTR